MSHVIIAQNGTDILVAQDGVTDLSPQIFHIPHVLLQDGINSTLLQNGYGNLGLQPELMQPRIRHGGIMRTIF